MKTRNSSNIIDIKHGDDFVSIYKNPTTRQLHGIMDKDPSHGARGLIHPETGDAYVWAPGYDTGLLHQHMRNHYLNHLLPYNSHKIYLQKFKQDPTDIYMDSRGREDKHITDFAKKHNIDLISGMADNVNMKPYGVHVYHAGVHVGSENIRARDINHAHRLAAYIAPTMAKDAVHPTAYTASRVTFKVHDPEDEGVRNNDPLNAITQARQSTLAAKAATGLTEGLGEKFYHEGQYILSSRGKAHEHSGLAQSRARIGAYHWAAYHHLTAAKAHAHAGQMGDELQKDAAKKHFKAYRANKYASEVAERLSTNQLREIVENAWTEEARRKSAETRRLHKKYKPEPKHRMPALEIPSIEEVTKDEPKHHPGSAHKSEVKIEKVEKRAFIGKPVETKATLSKQETGRVGEAIVLAYLRDIEGATDAKPMNSESTNFPVDMLEDHRPTEVKAGLISNSIKAQQWRLTFSKESKEEKEVYAKMTPEQRKEYNDAKQKRIHQRKMSIIKALEKKTGQKIYPRTMTVIINPDTRTADVYSFNGFHDRIGWGSEEAKKAYIGTVRYSHKG